MELNCLVINSGLWPLLYCIEHQINVFQRRLKFWNMTHLQKEKTNSASNTANYIFVSEWVTPLSSETYKKCTRNNPCIHYIDGNTCGVIWFSWVYPIFYTKSVGRGYDQIYACRNVAAAKKSITWGKSSPWITLYFKEQHKKY